MCLQLCPRLCPQLCPHVASLWLASPGGRWPASVLPVVPPAVSPAVPPRGEPMVGWPRRSVTAARVASARHWPLVVLFPPTACQLEGSRNFYTKNNKNICPRRAMFLRLPFRRVPLVLRASFYLEQWLYAARLCYSHCWLGQLSRSVTSRSWQQQVSRSTEYGMTTFVQH